MVLRDNPRLINKKLNSMLFLTSLVEVRSTQPSTWILTQCNRCVYLQLSAIRLTAFVSLTKCIYVSLSSYKNKFLNGQFSACRRKTRTMTSQLLSRPYWRTWLSVTFIFRVFSVRAATPRLPEACLMVKRALSNRLVSFAIITPDQEVCCH